LIFPAAFIYSSAVTGRSSITRPQISFAIAGVIFGFLLGFVAAHQLYGGRFSSLAMAGAPETMGGSRSPMPGGAPPGGPAGASEDGAPSMETMNQVKKELEALRKAVEANPRDVAALARLGNLYMDAAMFDRALEYYRRALDVDPGSPDTRTDMGTCLRQLGRHEEALAEFQESLKRDPSHWKSWFNIGIVHLYDRREYVKAEEAFAKVLELNPGAFDMDAVRAEIEKLK